MATPSVRSTPQPFNQYETENEHVRSWLYKLARAAKYFGPDISEDRYHILIERTLKDGRSNTQLQDAVVRWAHMAMNGAPNVARFPNGTIEASIQAWQSHTSTTEVFFTEHAQIECDNVVLLEDGVEPLDLSGTSNSSIVVGKANLLKILGFGDGNSLYRLSADNFRSYSNVPGSCERSRAVQ